MKQGKKRLFVKKDLGTPLTVKARFMQKNKL